MFTLMIHLWPVVSVLPSMSGLHQAALMGHTEIMEILLRAGAKVNLKDNKGNHSNQSAGHGNHLHNVGNLSFVTMLLVTLEDWTWLL